MNLTQRIKALLEGPMRGQGWCTPEKGNELALAVLKTRASVVVEIGVFFGSSLLPMAMACAEQNHGTVWAIDPWSREAAIEGYDGANADWWGNKVDLEAVYQTFLMHLKTQNVERFVKVIRAKSDDVDPPQEIDLLNVDGQHTEQASRDVERFASRVRLNGFCYMDDIDGWNGAPGRAVVKLESMGFVKLFNRDTGAMFQRTEIPGAKKQRGWPKGKPRRKKVTK
jgi:hypothetical protein